MCRFAICRNDPSNPDPDPLRRPAAFKRGDVPLVIADGKTFGDSVELDGDGGRFRIVNVPGLSDTDNRVLRLMQRDVGNLGQFSPLNPAHRTDLGWSTHKRDFNINLTALETLWAGVIGRALTNADQITITSLQDLKREIEDKLITRTPVPRSTVIG